MIISPTSNLFVAIFLSYYEGCKTSVQRYILNRFISNLEAVLRHYGMHRNIKIKYVSMNTTLVGIIILLEYEVS